MMGLLGTDNEGVLNTGVGFKGVYSFLSWLFKGAVGATLVV